MIWLVLFILCFAVNSCNPIVFAAITGLMSLTFISRMIMNRSLSRAIYHSRKFSFYLRMRIENDLSTVKIYLIVLAFIGLTKLLFELGYIFRSWLPPFDPTFAFGLLADTHVIACGVAVNITLTLLGVIATILTIDPVVRLCSPPEIGNHE